MVKPDFDVTFINTREAILRYTIRGFSEICGPEVSPPCYLLNLPWRILIMPWATQDEDNRWTKRYMSYYLQCSMEKRYSNWFCNVIGELDLLAVSNEKEPFRRKIKHNFSSKEDNFGYNCFMLWDDILDTDKGFIKDDTINLQLHLIIEAPEKGAIWYKWRDFTGRISASEKKKLQSQQMIRQLGSLLGNKKSSAGHGEDLTIIQKLKELFRKMESTEKL